MISITCLMGDRRYDLNPTWKPAVLNIKQVGSKENSLVIECYDFNNNGKHELMGKVMKSLHNNKNCTKIEGLNIYFFQQLPNKGNQTRPGLNFKSFMTTQSLSTYNCRTLNGNPRLLDSLDNIDPSGRPNAYQRLSKHSIHINGFWSKAD